MALEDGALVRDVNGLPTGKQPLRELYALYPDVLPASIANRSKVPFGEGAGLNVSPEDSLWKRRFEAEISDRDFRDGQREFFGFGLHSKEELYYLRKLAEAFDVMRVPHLRGRAQISFDMAQHGERLKAYAHARL
jgi:asparagine synthase (glutamine-hydrolysing)